MRDSGVFLLVPGYIWKKLTATSRTLSLAQKVFNSWLFHQIPQVPQVPPAQPPQPPPVPAMAWDGPLSPLLKAAKSEMARDVRIPSHCLH
jgi:hypothetical protein